jgi:hypothetical protein
MKKTTRQRVPLVFVLAPFFMTFTPSMLFMS